MTISDDHSLRRTLQMLRARFAVCVTLLILVGCGRPSAPNGAAAPAAVTHSETDAPPPPTLETPSSSSSHAATTQLEQPSADDHPELHNLMRVSERIYSGSQPHGDAGFKQIAELGVKVVVSVDGAQPDLARAEKHGLRYVHIPIGYDGISDKAGGALARLVRELDGPFYVHCHHGKHRGPAAAAVACIAEGSADPKAALAILDRAGTSKGYAGLWRGVEYYTPPGPGAELPELVEVAEVGSLVAAMARLDRNYDHLTRSRDAGWSVPSEHPDLVPAQEALLVREGLHEIGRQLADGYDDEFRARLTESEGIAADLEAALGAGDAWTATAHLERLNQSCKACHVVYRDLTP